MSATRPEIIGKIWVCFDCHLHHHYKETNPESITAPWCLMLDADVTDTSEQVDFSAAPCPACGTKLAGTRHKYAVWE